MNETLSLATATDLSERWKSFYDELDAEYHICGIEAYNLKAILNDTNRREEAENTEGLLMKADDLQCEVRFVSENQNEILVWYYEWVYGYDRYLTMTADDENTKELIAHFFDFREKDGSDLD